MRKFSSVTLFILLCLSVPAQEIQHEATAINIEVPVRVKKDGTFVDDLTISDFEVYEDGILQKIEAICLIKKTDIERKEKLKILPGQDETPT